MLPKSATTVEERVSARALLKQEQHKKIQQQDDGDTCNNKIDNELLIQLADALWSHCSGIINRQQRIVPTPRSTTPSSTIRTLFPSSSSSGRVLLGSSNCNRTANNPIGQHVSMTLKDVVHILQQAAPVSSSSSSTRSHPCNGSGNTTTTATTTKLSRKQVLFAFQNLYRIGPEWICCSRSDTNNNNNNNNSHRSNATTTSDSNGNATTMTTATITTTNVDVHILNNPNTSVWIIPYKYPPIRERLLQSIQTKEVRSKQSLLFSSSLEGSTATTTKLTTTTTSTCDVSTNNSNTIKINGKRSEPSSSINRLLYPEGKKLKNETDAVKTKILPTVSPPPQLEQPQQPPLPMEISSQTELPIRTVSTESVASTTTRQKINSNDSTVCNTNEQSTPMLIVSAAASSTSTATVDEQYCQRTMLSHPKVSPPSSVQQNTSIRIQSSTALVLSSTSTNSNRRTRALQQAIKTPPPPPTVNDNNNTTSSPSSFLRINPKLIFSDADYTGGEILPTSATSGNKKQVQASPRSLQLLFKRMNSGQRI